MKKVFSVVLFGVIVLGLLSACAPTAAPTKEAAPAKVEPTKKPLRIGFTLPTLQFPFYVRMHDQFLKEAEARGWQVVYGDGNLDSLTQVNASLDLLNNKVDVLVMATWWIDAMADVFDVAKKSNIPVFIMDKTAKSIPNGTTFASAAGVDSYDAGYVGGVWMAKRLAAEGKKSVNLIWVAMTDDFAIQRCKGFSDGMKANGITVNLLNQYLGDTRAKGMQSMEDALVTYPKGKIDLVFGYSAQSSLGAYDAIVAANRNEIQVVGFDGEDDEIKLIDQCKNYIGTVYQQPDKMSTVTAQLIEKVVVNGQTIEQDNPVPVGVYDGNGKCPTP